MYDLIKRNMKCGKLRSEATRKSSFGNKYLIKQEEGFVK